MRISIKNTTTRTKAVKLGRGITATVPQMATVVATFLTPPSKESYEKMVESGLIFEVVDELEAIAADSPVPATTEQPPPAAPPAAVVPPTAPEPADWQKGLKK